MAALRTPRRLTTGLVGPDHVGDRTTLFGTSGSTEVIIAAPHPAFRAGIRASLGLDFRIAGEATTTAELEALFETTHADLLLLDESLPDGGIRAVARAAPPNLKVVVFADEANDEQVIEALRLGASGYLLKGIRTEQLGATLRAVMSGEPALTRTLLGALVNEIVRTGSTPHLTLVGGGRISLTPREREVAQLMTLGQTTSEIAAALAVSAVTARRHISALMRKLDVETRAEAITALVG